MMKSLFFLSAGLLCCLLFSIEIQAQSGSESKWAAGIVFSPDYAYRTISFPDSANTWKEFLDENDFPKFGYSAGVSLLYRLHNNFELESGLLYSNKGHRYRSPILDQWHEDDPVVPLEALSTYNFRYLDIPLKLNWFFLQKQVRLFLSTGLSAGFFIDASTVQKVVFPDRTETNKYNEEHVDFNAVTLSFLGGAGMDYSLTERIFIRLNPEFRRGITPVADIPWKRYNWSLGMNIGIYYKIKKSGTSSHPLMNFEHLKN